MLKKQDLYRSLVRRFLIPNLDNLSSESSLEEGIQEAIYLKHLNSFTR